MELRKIFEVWSEYQQDNKSVRNKWCEIDEYLYKNCSDNVREVLEGYLLEFGALTEEAGFYAGYKSSFQLWLEVINDKGIE